MNSNQSKIESKVACRFASKVAFFTLAMITSLGCQQFPWPGSQRAKQFQVDSERMLSEFRAQKKRADELAAKNQQLETRLAESEKSLARQNLQSLSQSGSSSSRNGRRGNTPSKPANSKLFVGPADDEDPGLPDVPPSMSGLLTSGSGFSKPDSVAPDQNGSRDSLQWRPVRRK